MPLLLKPFNKSIQTHTSQNAISKLVRGCFFKISARFVLKKRLLGFLGHTG